MFQFARVLIDVRATMINHARARVCVYIKETNEYEDLGVT